MLEINYQFSAAWLFLFFASIDILQMNTVLFVIGTAGAPPFSPHPAHRTVSCHSQPQISSPSLVVMLMCDSFYGALVSCRRVFAPLAQANDRHVFSFLSEWAWQWWKGEWTAVIQSWSSPSRFACSLDWPVWVLLRYVSMSRSCITVMYQSVAMHLS